MYNIHIFIHMYINPTPCITFIFIHMYINTHTHIQISPAYHTPSARQRYNLETDPSSYTDTQPHRHTCKWPPSGQLPLSALRLPPFRFHRWRIAKRSCPPAWGWGDEDIKKRGAGRKTITIDGHIHDGVPSCREGGRKTNVFDDGWPLAVAS